VKFGFIAKHRGIWPVGWLCEALGVSRGGLYAWLTRPRSQRSRSDEELGAQVRASFLASDRTYGARRVWRDLLTEGVSCGLHRIERLMRLQALKARPRTCSIAPSRHLLPTANGLRTSHMFGRQKAGFTSPSSSISSPGVLSARFYNPKRRHSRIGYMSPMEFEKHAGLA
jgi:putative transposase